MSTVGQGILATKKTPVSGSQRRRPTVNKTHECRIELFSSPRLLLYWRHGNFDESIRTSRRGEPSAAKLVGVLSDLWFEDVQSKVPLPLLEFPLPLFHELQRI
jgi:hypothetical protein